MSSASMLSKVVCFESLSDQELEAMAGSLERRTFARGMVIFHKRAIGRRLYTIESGKVRIFLLSESGQEISVNIYGPGDVFGELALLDGLPSRPGPWPWRRR